MRGTLKAGFGRTDITPELGVRLGGYGVKERPAEEILDRLHSTVMVLEKDGLSAAVINLDWICVEEPVDERIRAGAGQRTGIDPKNITVCGTHSHSVPNTLNFMGWGNSEDAYIDLVIPKIIRSVELAKSNIKKVQAGFATVACLAGVNRRGITENNDCSFRADPNGSFDPTMTVVRFRDESGADAGIIIHYGAHGTAMGNNRIVSRDWCGVMKDRIEPQFSAPVVFLNGTIGDTGPRTNYLNQGGLSAGVGDGVHAVREVGYCAATNAIGALLSIREWRGDLVLETLTEDIFLPYAPLTSLADAERELAKWAPQKDTWGSPMCEYMHNQAIIDAHKKPLLSGRNFTQTITRLGPLAFVPMPGEPFSAIALRIRQWSPFQYTLCCSVSNGSMGYFPTREARHRGGYETWIGKAGGAYLFADSIDDALVGENIRLLRKIAKA